MADDAIAPCELNDMSSLLSLYAEQMALIVAAAGAAVMVKGARAPVCFGATPDAETVRRIAGEILAASDLGAHNQRLAAGPPIALHATARTPLGRAFGVLIAFDTEEKTVSASQRRQAALIAEKLAALHATSGAMERSHEQAEALKRSEARLREEAMLDPATGLDNQRGFAAAMEGLIAEAQRRGRGVGLVRADFDDWRRSLAVCGADAALRLLQSAAERLAALKSEGALIARLDCGGFALAMSYEDEAAVAALAQNVRLALSGEAIASGAAPRGAARVGYVAARTRVELGRLRADAELALAKAERADAHPSAYAAPLRVASEEREALAHEIRLGLAQGAFIPYFQPQFCARSRRIVAVEALARWRRPDGEVFGPGRFLEVAEEIGVLAQLDRAIMDQCFSARLAWARATHGAPPRLCLNVTAETLAEPGWADHLLARGLPHGALSLELLESVSMERNAHRLGPVLDRLMAAGFEVELDDFGSDNASLVGMLAFTPTRLKLDRRLIARAEHEGPGRFMVEAIIGVAASMGVAVTAEGVETSAQADAMTALGCSLLQGFGLAKPMPQEELLARLSADLAPARPAPLQLDSHPL
ncbi:MAG: bifunctional diguanylate cyclase/phosphodiesterase [Pseudomonadota bacterium]